jgi:Uri superfamily endonuclease
MKPVPGAYALLIALDCSSEIIIGRLGKFRFPAGFYLYVGSALGPGGLARRVARHLRAEKRLHWHVDYLLDARCARVVEVWTAESATRRECDWARAAMQLPGATIIAPRLGASDCQCAAHLSFTTAPNWAAFAALVGDHVQRWIIE